MTLNLARDAELRGNWQDLADAASAPAPAAPAEPGAAAAADFAIEGIRIVDGNVYWRENTDELRYSVTGLSLTTGGIGSGEPVEFDAALRFADEVAGRTAALAASAVVAVEPSGSVTATDVETSITVDAGGGAPARELEATAARIAFDRTAETLAVEELVTEIAGIRAAWQLSGTSLVANPTVGGSVTVDPAAISILFEQLQISPPTAIEPSELGTFALTAQFSLQTEPQVVQLTGVNAELLGMRVTGEGSLTGANELAGRIVIGEFTPNAAAPSAAARRGAADGRRRSAWAPGARHALRHEPRHGPSGAARPRAARARRNHQRHDRGPARRTRQYLPRRDRNVAVRS